jgi:hypothetical protein
MMLTTHCHLVPRSRTVKLYLHSSICLHGVLLNYSIEYNGCLQLYVAINVRFTDDRFLTDELFHAQFLTENRSRLLCCLLDFSASALSSSCQASGHVSSYGSVLSLQMSF